MRRSALILTVAAAGVAVTAAVAGTASSAPARHHAVSGNISMVGVWSGAEAKNFNMVLVGVREDQSRRPCQVHVGG